MNANVANLILEKVNRIDGRLFSIEESIASLKSDVSILKESVRRIDSRVASMDSHLAGFHAKSRWQTDEIDDLRGRVEALERPDGEPER